MANRSRTEMLVDLLKTIRDKKKLCLTKVYTCTGIHPGIGKEMIEILARSSNIKLMQEDRKWYALLTQKGQLTISAYESLLTRFAKTSTEEFVW